MIGSKEYYFNIFRVDQPLLDSLVEEALRSGGSYSDLYFENTTYGSLCCATEPSLPAAATRTSAWAYAS